MNALILIGHRPGGPAQAYGFGGWVALESVPTNMHGLILTPLDGIEAYAATVRRRYPTHKLSAMTTADFLKSRTNP